MLGFWNRTQTFIQSLADIVLWLVRLLIIVLWGAASVHRANDHLFSQVPMHWRCQFQPRISPIYLAFYTHECHHPFSPCQGNISHFTTKIKCVLLYCSWSCVCNIFALRFWCGHHFNFLLYPLQFSNGKYSCILIISVFQIPGVLEWDIASSRSPTSCIMILNHVPWNSPPIYKPLLSVFMVCKNYKMSFYIKNVYKKTHFIFICTVL